MLKERSPRDGGRGRKEEKEKGMKMCYVHVQYDHYTLQTHTKIKILSKRLKVIKSKANNEILAI